MRIRALIVGVAALLLATGAAHAERRLGPFYKPPAGSPSPWTEADGEDIIFFAVQGITCEGVNYSVWQPYNVKLQKQLDFLRLTPVRTRPLPANSLTLIRVGSAMVSCVKICNRNRDNYEKFALSRCRCAVGAYSIRGNEC
jgi:hypothetical protein